MIRNSGWGLMITNRRGRPAQWGRPQISADRLTKAFCVGGYIGDDNYVGNWRTDQNDGATYIVGFAHDRNDFAAAISSDCGDGGHEWPITI